MEDYKTPSQRQGIIDSYDSWIRRLTNEGFVPHLTSFTFKPIKGTTNTILERMKASVAHVFKIITINTTRKRKVDEGPRMIAVPDLPVRKHDRVLSREQLGPQDINSGLHFHGALMLPCKTRLHVPLEQQIGEWHGTYLRHVPDLMKVHVEKFDSPEVLGNYIFKSYKLGKVDYDPLILGPRG
jgi:hypothetical protein